jgi:hypothetical protein
MKVVLVTLAVVFLSFNFVVGYFWLPKECERRCEPHGGLDYISYRGFGFHCDCENGAGPVALSPTFWFVDWLRYGVGGKDSQP